MEKWKLLAAVLVTFFFAGFAAADAYVYEDFEYYTVGGEGSEVDGDLWWNWARYGVGDGNPFLNGYVDDVIKYEGNKSMRLDAPLTDHNTTGYFPTDADWGVQIRDDYTTVDVSAYNVMTAMVRAGKNSSITGCSLTVRDASWENIGVGDAISVPNDGNWHKVIVILNGTGSKSAMEIVLPFFTITPGSTGSQLWIDNITFDNMLLADDLLDVNGVYGNAGGSTQYTFRMTEQPDVDVTFTLTPPAELNLGAGFGAPVALTFTNGNWNVWQTITVQIAPSINGTFKVNSSISSTNSYYDNAVDGGFNIQVLVSKYGAPYVISESTPTWIGGDALELSNGIIAAYLWDVNDVLNPDWVEWAPDATGGPAYAEVTFDLGYAKDVNSIVIYHEGLYYPAGIFEVSFSTDGVNYSEPIEQDSINGYFISKTRINVNPVVNARYVKLIAKCIDDDPANWFFLSEVQFNVPFVPPVPPYYTIDTANIPLGDFTDPEEKKLMDGVINYFTDSLNWVYFNDEEGTGYDSAILYANFGEIKKFSNLSLNYWTGWGVLAPSEVILSFSNDGINYGTPISLSGWYTGEGGGNTDAKQFPEQQGQYVKIEIVKDAADPYCLRIGEVILSNRPQITYTIDSTTPPWGKTTEEPSDIAYENGLVPLNFGDLTNNYIPKLAGPYYDRDWVEWAPDQLGQPAYALITFDLGLIQRVKNVGIVYLSQFYNMPSPGGIEVAYSTDNINYSSFVDTGAEFLNRTEVTICKSVFDLPDTDARYVKLKIKCADDDAGNWFFISEVKFNTYLSDFDDNQVVDFEDLQKLCSQWLTTTANPSADIAGYDGQVNFLDFAEFAKEWIIQ
jgi:hypothetical protein